MAGGTLFVVLGIQQRVASLMIAGAVVAVLGVLLVTAQSHRPDLKEK